VASQAPPSEWCTFQSRARRGHWNHHEDADYYSQPGALSRLMNPAAQRVLFSNTAAAVGGAPREIQTVVHLVGGLYIASVPSSASALVTLTAEP